MEDNNKRKRIKPILAVLVTIIFIGSVILVYNYFTDSGNIKDPPGMRIIGLWSTSILLSELGPSVTFVKFKVDGTYTWSFYLLYAFYSEIGTYKILDDRLMLITDGQENTKRFTFDKTNLIITENDGYKYYFRKILKLK